MVVQNLLKEKNDLRNLILYKKYNCHNKGS